MKKEIQMKKRKINSRLIQKIARTWLGTRFHFSGRIRKNNQNNGGVDCIGLIIKIGEEIGVTYDGKNIVNYDYLTYSRYPNKGEMKSFLNKYFVKITEKQAKTGDLIYFNFDNRLEHIAIISDMRIIHCYIEAGKVVEHSLNDYWRDKIVGYYRFGNC